MKICYGIHIHIQLFGCGELRHDLLIAHLQEVVLDVIGRDILILNASLLYQPGDLQAQRPVRGEEVVLFARDDHHLRKDLFQGGIKQSGDVGFLPAEVVGRCRQAQ